MERITLNRALNKEMKLYGLSFLGIMGAGVIGIIAWLCLGMIVGILGFAIGYTISATLARHWHNGDIQRVLYWHLSGSRLFGGKYLPQSHKRCFM